jgi:hypothetical protein
VSITGRGADLGIGISPGHTSITRLASVAGVTALSFSSAGPFLVLPKAPKGFRCLSASLCASGWPGPHDHHDQEIVLAVRPAGGAAGGRREGLRYVAGVSFRLLRLSGEVRLRFPGERSL